MGKRQRESKIELNLHPFLTTTINFYAFINGIEIVSTPKDLYYSPKGTPDEKVPCNVDGHTEFYINYTSALEKVFRFNGGGSSIAPIEDTSFFRRWYPDEEYFLSKGMIYFNESFIPKYTEIPNYIALDEVYRTTRSMGRQLCL